MNASPQLRPAREYFSPAVTAQVLPGPGLPHDRHARIAARRCFVDLKQQFMDSLAQLDGMRGDWLRHQVRQAHEPVDLWLLRGAVFAALETMGDYGQRSRSELRRAIDSVFPDNGELLAYGARPVR